MLQGETLFFSALKAEKRYDLAKFGEWLAFEGASQSLHEWFLLGRTTKALKASATVMRLYWRWRTSLSDIILCLSCFVM